MQTKGNLREPIWRIVQTGVGIAKLQNANTRNLFDTNNDTQVSVILVGRAAEISHLAGHLRKKIYSISDDPDSLQLSSANVQGVEAEEMGEVHKSATSLALIALIVATSLVSLAAVVRPARALTLYSSGNPTPDEQLVLEYINRARANPVAEGQRLGIDITEGLQDDPSNGCYGPEDVQPRPPLAMNSILLSVAEAHSLDMYTRNYFDHTTPDGITAFQRMTNAGYDFVSAGENIGAGTGMTAAQLEDELMLDPGYPCRAHRMNLLDIFPSATPAYLEVGIGYYQGSSGQAFITEDFGTASQGPFLTGVVYSNADGSNFYAMGEGISGVTITPGSGDYYAVTSSSGGYQLPIPTSGTITVTASGGGIGSISKTITLTGENVELDFTPQGAVTTATTTTTSQSATQSSTQTSTQSSTQTTIQTTSQSTSTQPYQLMTQTQTFSASSSTTVPLLESVLFQSLPSAFLTVSLPPTITACGSTFSYSQSATACGLSFGATANLPTPTSGWMFDHWTWAGGVSCSSVTSNPDTCSAFNSGGILIAVYAAQVTVLINSNSPVSVNWGACSTPGVGNGGSFFSSDFGQVNVAACDIPAGYSFSSWTCSGGLTCQTSANPTTVTFTGPGTIQLNVQEQPSNNTTTSSQVTSTEQLTTTTVGYTAVYSTASSATTQSSTSIPLTLAPIPGFPWESILAGIFLGIVLLNLLRRRNSIQGRRT